MFDPPIEIPGSSEAAEADDIEHQAAERAYRCGLGVGEWEAFLTFGETKRLIWLGDAGFGTWAQEPARLAQMKASVLVDSRR